MAWYAVSCMGGWGQASDVIRGYPIEGMAELLPSGVVPPQAFALQVGIITRTHTRALPRTAMHRHVGTHARIPTGTGLLRTCGVELQGLDTTV